VVGPQRTGAGASAWTSEGAERGDTLYQPTESAARFARHGANERIGFEAGRASSVAAGSSGSGVDIRYRSCARRCTRKPEPTPRRSGQHRCGRRRTPGRRQSGRSPGRLGMPRGVFPCRLQSNLTITARITHIRGPTVLLEIGSAAPHQPDLRPAQAGTTSAGPAIDTAFGAFAYASSGSERTQGGVSLLSSRQRTPVRGARFRPKRASVVGARRSRLRSAVNGRARQGHGVGSLKS
jgi:hypothetical protein